MDGALLRAPGNTQRPDMTADAEHPRQRRRRPDLVRHLGVHGAGGQHVRQPDRATAPASTQPAYYNLDASMVKRFDIGNKLRRVPRRRLQRHEHAAPEQPERHVRQRDVRPDHERLRSAHRAVRPAVRVLGIKTTPGSSDPGVFAGLRPRAARGRAALEAADLRRRRWRVTVNRGGLLISASSRDRTTRARRTGSTGVASAPPCRDVASQRPQDRRSRPGAASTAARSRPDGRAS